MCVTSAREDKCRGESLLSRNVKRLSRREYQVLILHAGGMKRAAASEFMGISVNSHRVYLDKIVKKLRARNMTHAVYLATVSGLIVFPDVPLPGH